MNYPISDEFDKLAAAFQSLKHNGHFEAIMEWVRRERNARDAENRRPGSENRTSEAQALSVILDFHEGKATAETPRIVAGSVPHDQPQNIVSPGYEGAG